MTKEPQELQVGFFWDLNAGLRRVSRRDLDSSTAEKLQRQLDEFDSVRARGEVESHSAYLTSFYSKGE